MDMIQYDLIGKTYDIKEEIKVWGCKWIPDKKVWRTPPLDKRTIEYRQLNSLCLAYDVEMIPVDLPEQCKTIQNILNK